MNTSKIRFLIKGFFLHYYDNSIHKVWVFYYLMKFMWLFRLELNFTAIAHLFYRGIKHDLSKYGWQEARYFIAATDKRKDHSYGTPEYNNYLNIFHLALNHHYKNNSHHPQHYDGTINQMSRIDQIEMLCDWLASVKRNADGDIFKSLEINQERFHYDDYRKQTYKVIIEALK